MGLPGSRELPPFSPCSSHAWGCTGFRFCMQLQSGNPRRRGLVLVLMVLLVVFREKDKKCFLFTKRPRLLVHSSCNIVTWPLFIKCQIKLNFWNTNLQKNNVTFRYITLHVYIFETLINLSTVVRNQWQRITATAKYCLCDEGPPVTERWAGGLARPIDSMMVKASGSRM